MKYLLQMLGFVIMVGTIFFAVTAEKFGVDLNWIDYILLGVAWALGMGAVVEGDD